MTRYVQLPAIRKSKKGTLPNLIIIGAQKCGTTGLHCYLGLHPQISMSRDKELNFFIRQRNWHNGIEWYKSNFTGKARIHGESSPSYTNYPFFSGVPERMYSVVPEAKLIYILRDPIDRIISHYVHQYADRLENRTIVDALTDLDNNPYICRSKYYMQLGQYLNYFPKTNILIITQEDLYSHHQQTLQQVFRFLNVDDSFYSRKFSSMRHESKYKRRKNCIGWFLTRMPGMNIVNRLPSDIQWHFERLLYLLFSHGIEWPTLDESLREELIDHLRDDINRLREYTGCDLEGWCV